MSDLVQTLRDMVYPCCVEAADEITRLRVQNIQMQAALGYAICAEDERHIIPSNPYNCGVCEANKGIHAEIDRLRGDLEAADIALSRLNSGAELQTLMAENNRLRAALREIVDCHLDSTRRWAIARAALGDRT